MAKKFWVVHRPKQSYCMSSSNLLHSKYLSKMRFWNNECAQVKPKKKQLLKYIHSDIRAAKNFYLSPPHLNRNLHKSHTFQSIQLRNILEWHMIFRFWYSFWFVTDLIYSATSKPIIFLLGRAKDSHEISIESKQKKTLHFSMRIFSKPMEYVYFFIIGYFISFIVSITNRNQF